MRQQSYLLLAAGLIPSATAFAKRANVEESWQPAKPTAVVDNRFVENQLARGWTPRPTHAPRALFGRMNLEPRLDGYTLAPGTCGYVSSNGNSYTCIDTAAVCTYEDDYVGCCVPNSDCNLIKTTCIDYDAVEDGACDLPDDFHTLCCADKTRGACYTWLFSTSSGDSDELETYSFLDCSALQGTGTLLDYDPAWSATRSFPTETSETETETETETSTRTDTDDSEETGDDDGGDGGNGGDDDGGSSTNVGAIAGGTVGGVAAIGLVGAAAFLLMRRKKKNAGTPTDGTSTVGPMSHTGGPNSTAPPTIAPSSPATFYSSGVPAGYGGYPKNGQSQPYDPHISVHSQQGYPPQQYQNFQGHPQQYNNQYPQQGGLYPNQAYGYQPSSTASPPPHTTPSPGVGHASGISSPTGPGSPPHHAQELQAVNPVGMETNRAELG